eukprot:SAG11_NODE_38496_length_252_cov_0.673203_1_plen_55_part_10
MWAHEQKLNKNYPMRHVNHRRRAELCKTASRKTHVCTCSAISPNLLFTASAGALA